MVREKHVKAMEKYIAREICQSNEEIYRARNMSMHWRKYELLMLKGSKGRVCFGKGGSKMCHCNKISEYLDASIQQIQQIEAPKNFIFPKTLHIIG